MLTRPLEHEEGVSLLYKPVAKGPLLLFKIFIHILQEDDIILCVNNIHIVSKIK